MEIIRRIIDRLLPTLKRIVDYYDTSEEVEMHVCSLCGTIFLDAYSYSAHYTLNMCNIEMYPFNFDQIEIEVLKDE